MQDTTGYKIKHGEGFNLYLTHNQHRQQPMDGEEPIVWHEQILDEGWDQLEDALSGDKLVTNICDIHVENVEMTKERLAALVAILHSGRANISRTYVIFDNAKICGEGIIYLSKLVETSLEMQEFCLHHNPINNMDSARRLFRSLKSHARICELHLAHCDLGSTPEILLVVLQSDFISTSAPTTSTLWGRSRLQNIWRAIHPFVA
jgi:hypothetical protein